MLPWTTPTSTGSTRSSGRCRRITSSFSSRTTSGRWSSPTYCTGSPWKNRASPRWFRGNSSPDAASLETGPHALTRRQALRCLPLATQNGIVENPRTPLDERRGDRPRDRSGGRTCPYGTSGSARAVRRGRRSRQGVRGGPPGEVATGGIAGHRRPPQGIETDDRGHPRSQDGADVGGTALPVRCPRGRGERRRENDQDGEERPPTPGGGAPRPACGGGDGAGGRPPGGWGPTSSITRKGRIPPPSCSTRSGQPRREGRTPS